LFLYPIVAFFGAAWFLASRSIRATARATTRTATQRWQMPAASHGMRRPKELTNIRRAEASRRMQVLAAPLFVHEVAK